MASIVERPKKDGSLSFLITVSLGRDPSGKKLKKTTTFVPKSNAPTKARKEAEAYAIKYEQQVLCGDLVIDENATYADMVKIWEKNWLPAKTRSVRENYMRVQNSHALPFLGHLKLTTIRATHIDEIIKNEQKPKDQGGKGYAPKTVRMTFTVINSVFRYAFKKKFVHENPCLRCDELPPVTLKKGKDLRFFNADQTKRFLNDALTMEYAFTYGTRHRKNKRTGERYEIAGYTEYHAVPLQWRVYFNMAVITMFRRGEMCALTWADFNEKTNQLTVSKALASDKEGQYVKDPKTEAGNRTIYIPESLSKLLKRLKYEQKVRHMELGNAWKGHRDGLMEDGKTMDSFDNNTIFIRDNGTAVHLSTPGHKFHEICDLYNATREKEEDKLPRIRLHDLRHTGATLLIGNNTDIETVSKRCGHAKPSVTLDIYGHALPENDKKASDLFSRMLGS